ncbi:MAG: universal stress protein, partial [Rhodospirillales bacterium]|nr:universal stress protein [Rhodospirillales bacterium]
MTKIIALVDGSIYSQSVCDHSAWIAKQAGSAVEVLHVIGRRQTAGASANLSGNIALGARTSLLEELTALDVQMAKLSQKRGRAILDDAKASIEAAGVSKVVTRLRFGDIVETVAECEPDAEVVVIGKRGEDADFAKLHLGSNLERIVRSCQMPVFVTSRAYRPIERFLIAYDGGTSSRKAVDHVAQSSLFSGLQCHLLTVGADTEQTRNGLDKARAILEGAGYEVAADIIQGQPDRVISRVVKSEGIGLLVMGAYGHS